MKISGIFMLFAALLLLAACGQSTSSEPVTGSSRSAASGEHKIIYYRDPMNPVITSPVPKKDSMGMDYVPVYASEENSGQVRIAPAVEQELGILTAPVLREDLHRLIHTVGYVSFDQSTVARLHTRAAGWITELPISSAGERVRRGQLLFRLYSPTLITTEQEYLQALKAGNATFIEASDRRLVALGIGADEIARLKQTREASKSIAYYAERGGVVEALNARPGLYVTPDIEVLRLGVLAQVWLVAEVFENQAGWVAVGDEASARLASAPGEVLHGRVNFIYPGLDPVTRTLKVRMTFDNPEAALLPNMYAEVTIAGAPEKNVLTIPSEALIRVGENNNRVILALGQGRFRAQPVTAGIESGGRVAILSGLEAGETVVTSGQFLIDSEANLKASLERLSAGNGSGGKQ